MKKIDAKMLRMKRRRRVRAKISGTADCPRLAISKSLLNISAQVIDDISGNTLVSAVLKEIKGGKNNIEGAAKVGKLIAEKCKAKGIKNVVFDRGGYLYHGKVKSLAEAAREGGLVF